MKFTFITRDFGLKAFSLVLGILLFVFVGSESATPVDVEFRIEYRTADDMMVVGDPPLTVQATLQGPWAGFRSFDTETLAPVVVDLTGSETGTSRHRIDTTDLKAPAGMKIVALRPSELEVTLDRRVERLVPVEPDIVERPALGYEIVEIKVEPKQVRVEGPMGRMRSLDFVSTRPIDVGGREADVNLEVELRPPSPGLRLLERRVRVLITIGEEFVTRTFTAQKVVVANAPRGTHPVPEVIAFQLRGPRRLVDALPASGGFELVVDALPEVEEGQTTFEKMVTVRGMPERSVLVPPVPRVTVQAPKVVSKRPRK